MSLIDHARATRILAHAFAEESTNPHLPLDRRMLLRSIGTAYSVAAGLMEADDRAEAERMAEGHRCTLDHARLSVPKCPACSAPRG